LLESPKTLSQLADAVAREYHVDVAQVEREVTEFASEMKAVGLVEVPTALAMAGD
jgi:Coenzyme PQQ synthesis protein D (PqqD)